MKLVAILLGVCLFAKSAYGIIGGTQIHINKHPYQVAVLSSGKFVSSGVIIKDNVILTDITAHRQMLLKYTFEGHSGMLSVRAGSSSKDEDGVEVKVKSSNVIKSPLEDFSILFLEKPLVFNENISNIQVTGEKPRMGANCSISGWGANNTSYAYPNSLQGANVTLVSSSNCVISKSDEPVVSGEFCIRGGDACVGDSGAPLVCEGTLAGIASTLSQCNTGGFGGSYIDIQSIRLELETAILFSI